MTPGKWTRAITAMLLLAVLAACSNDKDQRSNDSADTTDSLRNALAAADRPLADRRRDDDRKPAEVIEFLGITPGMKAIDLIAGAGYYTEVLALAV